MQVVLGLPIELVSALTGGLLALLGALMAIQYQSMLQTRTLRRALRKEIEVSNLFIDPLIVIDRVIKSGGDWNVDISDLESVTPEAFAEISKDKNAWAWLFLARNIRERYSPSTIFDSNTDKLGYLMPDEAEALIHYHAALSQLYSTIDIVISEITPGETSEDDVLLFSSLMDLADSTFSLRRLLMTVLEESMYERKIQKIIRGEEYEKELVNVFKSSPAGKS